MVKTRSHSVVNMAFDGDSAKAEGGGAWQKSEKKRKKSKSTSASPLKLLDSDPPSPCKVCKHMVTDEGVQCDRCESWVHGVSGGGCSGLSPSMYNFIVMNPAKSIKWFCPACEKETTVSNPDDKLAQQGAKLETLTAIVLALQQQNKIILDLLMKEQTIEEKIKVQVTEALDNQKEKEDRMNNIVMFNIQESSAKGRDAEMKHDQDEIKKILTHVLPDLDPSKITDQNITRLGRRADPTNTTPNPKPRPVKLVLDNAETRNRILKKAWTLKDCDNYKRVGISADKTLEERKADRLARQEFLRRKNEGDDVIMYKGKIMKKTERDALRSGTAGLAASVPPGHSAGEKRAESPVGKKDGVGGRKGSDSE